MGSSSDWLTALLERPQDSELHEKPISWLPDFAKDEGGFVEGMPLLKPAANPMPEPEAAPRDPAQDVPDGMAREMTGDALVDVLRVALEKGEDAEATAARAEISQSPEVESPTVPEVTPEPPPSPAPDPIAEAFAKGKSAGIEAAKAELASVEAQKLVLRQSFRALDQAAMDAVASELAETVIVLCAQTLADYAPNRDALHERCAEAARRLGGGAGGATLYLHPDDLALLDADSLGGWRAVGDPNAERGGVRFETTEGSISDRPSDWRRAIAAAIRG